MFGPTKITVLLCLFCCYHFSSLDATTNRQKTKNGQLNNHNVAKVGDTEASVESKKSSDGASGTNDIADGTKPTKSESDVFQNLMRSSVNVMQFGMDKLQDASTSVFQGARDRNTKLMKEKSISSGTKVPPGFVEGISNSMSNMVYTGMSGIEHATDLGLAVGNMGTTIMRSEIDGTDVNREILKILVKYVASRVGKCTKGDVDQFINDIGVISTFVAEDEDVTRSISIIMKKFMENPKVSAAIIRMTLIVMESSKSTSCLLDQMPLKASDLRMLFNVFVGSSGQLMMTTLAGMLKEMTTGPDTKEFLQSILSMLSMFKSDSPKKPNEAPEAPTSVIGKLTSLFAKDDEEDEDEDENTPVPSKAFKKKKIGNPSDAAEKNAKQKKPMIKPKLANEDISWFDNDDDSAKPLKKPKSMLSQDVDSEYGNVNSAKRKTKHQPTSTDYSDDT